MHVTKNKFVQLHYMYMNWVVLNNSTQFKRWLGMSRGFALIWTPSIYYTRQKQSEVVLFCMLARVEFHCRHLLNESVETIKRTVSVTSGPNRMNTELSIDRRHWRLPGREGGKNTVRMRVEICFRFRLFCRCSRHSQISAQRCNPVSGWNSLDD